MSGNEHVLVSVPVPTGVDRKRIRLSGGGVATAAGDDSWLSADQGEVAKVVTSSSSVVPSIKLEDCLFSPEVAKIMANYKPPAAATSSMPLAPAPDAFPETAIEPVATSPKGAEQASSSSSSSRAPSPRPCAPTSSAATEPQAAGATAAQQSLEQALLEQALIPVTAAAAATTTTTDVPAFWSYNASTTTFGLKYNGELQPAAAARPTTYGLSPWILTDGPPVFAATSSLKRKRELDQSQIVHAQLQELVGATRREMGQGGSAPAPAIASGGALQDLMFLVESEKAAGSALDQKVTDAILAPCPNKL